MTTDTHTNRRTAIWGRVVQFEEPLSPMAARALLRIRFSDDDLTQMEVLSAKARAGSLSAQEQTDLDNYEQLGCLLDILHSQARRALKPRRTAS
jgi:hypothetical protein